MSTLRFILLWALIGWWYVPITYFGCYFAGLLMFDALDGIDMAREATDIFWRNRL